MVKIMGGALVIAVTTLCGMKKAEQIRDQHRHLQYLYKIICSIQSEIRYARAYLSEIFIDIGEKSEEPYKKWLVNLGRDMEEQTGDVFADIWRKNIAKYLSDEAITGSEKERLLHLGNQLGIADLETQVRFLELHLQQMDMEMQELREGMGEKIRLCHCLGVMSGIMITVILL